MGRAKCLMIQGTMSGVGKSYLCAALCRVLRQDGFRAAPFKSQNMGLNTAFTAEGLEISRAQAVQAEAAGVPPDARMNPVLLKPSSDTGSQVVVLGRVREHMGAADYFRYKKTLFPEILAAYESLASEYDALVIEGAGSPVELNLKDGDIVNMGLAEAVDAPVLLAGDIDRGGVFAQLYGTVTLLEPWERRRVRGLILNKFRGDIALLRPGLGRLETLCAAPVLGVVPWLDARLDEEDSLSLSVRPHGKPLDIAVIRFPRIENFTDFAPLDRHPLLGVRYVDRRAGLGNPDLLILPGTVNPASDLIWLRETGLASEILSLRAAHGTPTLGICGGSGILRHVLGEPDGTIGDIGDIGNSGYGGNLWESSLHGLFDAGEAVDRLAEYLCRRKGLSLTSADFPPVESGAAYRERQYNLLADGVRAALDMDAVYRIMEGWRGT